MSSPAERIRNVARAAAPYPERREPNDRRADRWLAAAQARWLQPLAARFGDGAAFANQVEGLASEFRQANDERLRAEALDLSRRLRQPRAEADSVMRAFALIRECAGRTLGMRHHGVQLQGGLALLQGRIAEMETGEGKTLTATLAAGVAALSGIPVHIVTVNDYLAERDAQTMAPLYAMLGLSVGHTRQGEPATDRRRAYAQAIAYCTNKDLGFDYLRDRLALRDWPSAGRLAVRQALGGGNPAAGLLLRGLHFAIVDEADSILIDEARTPLIISGESRDDSETAIYQHLLEVARQLESGRDFEVFPKERTVMLTPRGLRRLEQLADALPPVYAGAAGTADMATQALSAIHLYERDRHYLLADGKVQIIDEYTGRVMPDRSWEHGLHQMIETKEGVELTGRRTTLTRITYQRLFRRYLHLAGMTGTAWEVRDELWSVYGLKVARIPTHQPVRRQLGRTRVLQSQTEKWQAVVASVRQQALQRGRPVLIGTRSVEASDALSAELDAAGIAHQVLNARQDADEATLVAQAGAAGAVTVATNMAGRGTDIKLAGGIPAIGGLHVILTEFHDAGRIDRQLFGRCARQGDPGSVECLVARDDELFRLYLPPMFQALLAALTPAPSWLSDLCRRAAQRRAERHHAQIRNQTFETDRQIEKMLAFTGRES